MKNHNTAQSSKSRLRGIFAVLSMFALVVQLVLSQPVLAQEATDPGTETTKDTAVSNDTESTDQPNETAGDEAPTGEQSQRFAPKEQIIPDIFDSCDVDIDLAKSFKGEASLNNFLGVVCEIDIEKVWRNQGSKEEISLPFEHTNEVDIEIVTDIDTYQCAYNVSSFACYKDTNDLIPDPVYFTFGTTIDVHETSNLPNVNWTAVEGVGDDISPECNLVGGHDLPILGFPFPIPSFDLECHHKIVNELGSEEQDPCDLESLVPCNPCDQILTEGVRVDIDPCETEETIVITGDTTSTENDPGKWMFNRDPSTATPFEFNTDQPLIGTGSLNVLPIGSNPSDKFIGEHFLNEYIDDVKYVKYNFKIGAGGDNNDEEQFYMSVYANFGVSPDNKFYDCRYNVVPTIGSTGSFTEVVFDPTLTYPVTQSGSPPFACPASPSGMDGLSDGSTIRMFALNVGDTSTSDVGIDGYLDKVVKKVGNHKTTYDFEPAGVTIEAQKVVCDNEIYLPNMEGGANITATTAADFVAANSAHCHLEDWDFQWGFADKNDAEGVDMTTGDWVGPAAIGGNSSGLCPAPWCGSNVISGTGYNQWKDFSTSSPAVITDLEGADSIWVREKLKAGYHPFSAPVSGQPLNDDDVTAEIYCSSDVLNYDNFEFITALELGETYHCVAFNAAKGVVIEASKIVCDAESYLPNWGESSPVNFIGATTGQEFVDNSDGHCRFADEWNFQWGYGDKEGISGVDMTTGTNLGPANGVDTTGMCSTPWCGPNTATGLGYGDWRSFPAPTVAGVTQVVIDDLQGADKIWVREELKPGYVPFADPESGLNLSNDVSAEIYCHDDVYNYDNYDFVGNPEVGNTYYCLAINAPKGNNENPCHQNDFSDQVLSKLEDIVVPGIAVDQCFDIAGLVYHDVNQSFLPDDGDIDLSGWKVRLYNYDADDVVGVPGSVYLETTSDVNGNYLFDEVLPGCYVVEEVPESGWIQMQPGEDFLYYVALGNADCTFPGEEEKSPVEELLGMFVNTAHAAVDVTDNTVHVYGDAIGLDFGNFPSDQGGCTENCSNGGGGGSRSSGSSSKNNDDDEGQVLGDTTTIPSSPEVLGASTLPRTGTPSSSLLVLLLALAIPAVVGYKLFAVKRA